MYFSATFSTATSAFGLDVFMHYDVKLVIKDSTLPKNMTANENSTINNITSIILAIYVPPEKPVNPVKRIIYLMHDPTNANTPYNLTI